MSSQEKQEYLRIHIIEKNLDPELFISYLEQQKEDGANVENWDLEELKELVQEYTTSLEDGTEIQRRQTTDKEQLNVFGKNNKNSSDSDSSDDEGQAPTEPKKAAGYQGLSSSDEGSDNDDDQEKKNEDNDDSSSSDDDEEEEVTKKEEKKEEEKLNNDSSSSSSSSDDEEEEKMEENPPVIQKIVQMDEDEEDALAEDDDVPAGKSGKSSKYYSKRKVNTYTRTVLVTDDKIVIDVAHPEIVKSKQFFKGTYTIYTIKVNPFEWTVKRRYSDFEWLYNTLVKRFPANYVKN